MNDIKVVVVDDSPFSVALITDILNQSGFNVIGNASSLEETIEVVTSLKPDIVTMDMTLPGTDGLECTRAIHLIDPNIKVIIVSSMMDDEIIEKAKKNKAVGYIQKPVDSEEITLLINRIMASEDLFKELAFLYYPTFKESFNDTFNKFTKTVPSFMEENRSNVEHESQGICIIMGIIGKYSGRMLLNMSYDTAGKIAEVLLKRTPKNSEEIHNVMSEFSNIVSGMACSTINRKNKLFGLRVAPPTIFFGESITVSKGHLDVTASATANTAYGTIYISIGFIRGAAEWTTNI